MKSDNLSAVSSNEARDKDYAFYSINLDKSLALLVAAAPGRGKQSKVNNFAHEARSL